MTWIAVARKDFRDAIRSRAIWALYLLFLVFAAGATFVYVAIFGSVALTTNGLAQFLQRPMGLLVSLTALLAGYKSVAGERASGSINLLLSLPHSRLDVLLGKTLGRAGVVGLPVLVSLVVPFATGLVRVDGFDVPRFLAFVAATLLFTLAYVSVGVGLSAVTESTGVAAVLAFGYWFVFQFAWSGLVTTLEFVVEGFSLGAALGPDPAWVRLLKAVTPGNGYASLVRAPFHAVRSADPFVLQDWFGAVVLAAWVAVPFALGYWRFERADL